MARPRPPRLSFRLFQEWAAGRQGQSSFYSLPSQQLCGDQPLQLARSIHMNAYLCVHDAHHRAQVLMVLRLAGHRWEEADGPMWAPWRE
jgi:hypothetical protein